MIIYSDAILTQPEQMPSEPKCALICIASNSETALLPAQLKPHLDDFFGREDGTSTHFESRRDHDYISLRVPDIRHPMEEYTLVEIRMDETSLLVVHEDHLAINTLIEDLDCWKGDMTPGRVLYQLINRLTEKDSARLEDIEEEIANLEDTVIDTPPKNSTELISYMRKRLLVLKRYYEGLLDLLEDLEENQNALLAKTVLQAFRLQTNRANRLFHAVLNLRDYVTQVRESYQAQIDISLNQTMKLFTVITAIFLPLTLIAGWYGMNLAMPEFNWPYAYLGVILLSLSVVVGCIVYFKRNKWF